MSPDYPPPPAELGWITRVIGPEATRLLIKEFGGTRLHVWETVDPQGELARAIGMEAALAACKAWSVNRLRIPLARAWQARCLQAEGKNNRQIARELRVAETSVADLLHGRRQSRDNRALRGLPAKLSQPDLFEEAEG